MTITLGNGMIVPLHWNDRFYEGDCPVCKAEIWEKTPTDWHSALIQHWEIMQH